MEVTGWIKPDRTFVACSRYAHIQLILDTLQEDLDIDHLLENLEEIRESCEQTTEEDGCGTHAVWHVWGIAEGDARCKVYNILLDRGYIRVGTYNKTIHFEGRSQTLEGQKSQLQDFCKERECDWEFEPMEKPRDETARVFITHSN